MHKLAVAVSNLAISQANVRFIINANRLLAARTDLDVIALFETVQKPCVQPNFAAMHITEGWGFDGPVVATNLSTARKLIRFPSVSHRVFYAQDLEWLRGPRQSYRELRAVYGDPGLLLLARSRDHAEVMCRCWNRPVGVVPDFNLEALLALVPAHAKT